MSTGGLAGLSGKNLNWYNYNLVNNGPTWNRLKQRVSEGSKRINLKLNSVGVFVTSVGLFGRNSDVVMGNTIIRHCVATQN